MPFIDSKNICERLFQELDTKLKIPPVVKKLETYTDFKNRINNAISMKCNEIMNNLHNIITEKQIVYVKDQINKIIDDEMLKFYNIIINSKSVNISDILNFQMILPIKNQCMLFMNEIFAKYEIKLEIQEIIINNFSIDLSKQFGIYNDLAQKVAKKNLTNQINFMSDIKKQINQKLENKTSHIQMFIQKSNSTNLLELVPDNLFNSLRSQLLKNIKSGSKTLLLLKADQNTLQKYLDMSINEQKEKLIKIAKTIQKQNQENLKNNMLEVFHNKYLEEISFIRIRIERSTSTKMEKILPPNTFENIEEKCRDSIIQLCNQQKIDSDVKYQIISYMNTFKSPKEKEIYRLAVNIQNQNQEKQ